MASKWMPLPDVLLEVIFLHTSKFLKKIHAKKLVRQINPNYIKQFSIRVD